MQLKKGKARRAMLRASMMLIVMLLVTWNFDRSRTRAQLRRLTRYRERKSRSVGRPAFLQICHLRKVGNVAARRRALRASTAGHDVAALQIILHDALIFVL